VTDNDGQKIFSFVYGAINGAVPANTATNTIYQITTFGTALATASTNLYQGGNPYQASNGVLNTRYRSCKNDDTNVSVTCGMAFSCQGTTPTNASICSYSTTGANEVKKDDRELKQNVNKKLISRSDVSASRYQRCGGNVNNSNPGTKDELNGQIDACNIGTGQNVKCEFYCPAGYHKETVSGVEGCYQNSVRKGITEVSTGVYGGLTVTYNPDCLDAGQTTTVTEKKTIT
jgi:hypothetical protein